MTRDGEVFDSADSKQIAAQAGSSPVLICNRALTESKTGGILPARASDILELFAFACPAVKCTPTTKDIAAFLKLPVPVNMYEEARVLFDIVKKLFQILAQFDGEERADAASLAATMLRSGNWGWGADVLAALGQDVNRMRLTGLSGFAVWNKLSEWTDSPPAEPAGTLPVLPDEAEDRLKETLNRSIENVRKIVPEARPEQVEYARFAAAAFDPKNERGKPVCVLSEAGTGVGKTLGYLSSVGVWSEKNAGAVWISTYTRNLQRQMDEELSRLFANESLKRRRTVIRKGRENYLCLLNYAEAVGRIQTRPASAIALGLIARWITKTKDGDVNGGDFPSWLSHMLGERSVSELADKRGECIYAQCPHFRKCFIEKIARRTRTAKIVIANHAFVMTQLAGAGDEQTLPTRFVFDEAHQIFNAADGIFCEQISGLSGVEMRRRLIGTNDTNSRMKGLKRRLEDIALVSPDVASALEEVLQAAAFLPRFSVQNRLKNETPENSFETFLCAVRRQVYARNDEREKLHSLECPPAPALPEVEQSAAALKKDVDSLTKALISLRFALEKYMNDFAKDMNAYEKQRADNILRSIEKTALDVMEVWGVMLNQIVKGAPSDFVDWFEVGRNEGTEIDTGYYRHWVDPTFPFAQMLGGCAQGVLMTSATLTDKTPDGNDWDSAMKRTGAALLNPDGTKTASIKSPFDYESNARVFILTDVNKNDNKQVAAAARELFLASNGGALGIFTAISRLKAVYKEIKKPLNDAGLLLLAQHVDSMDLTTLLDIFKSEEESCLLGTDAVRDGIDVPGKSLRLLLFDRMPWERPTIAHKRRRIQFEENGGRDYNMMLARMKLAQGFGRLIRKKDDRGVFVMLDKAVPSEALSAFPQGTPVEKVGLREAVAQIRSFLNP